MAIGNLGACEWFVADLRKSNLLERAKLDEVVMSYMRKYPNAEPPALAEHLVAQNLLTAYQSKRLLTGNADLVVGPYVLVGEVGNGSLGPVYRAESRTDGKSYAVKLLPRRNTLNASKARRIVKSFEGCDHAAVVPFTDVGNSGNWHYLVWPLVDGETLDKLIPRQGALEPELAAHYALQAAQGLDVLHQIGLVHGLVKPPNLMLGTDAQIRILDSGVNALLVDIEMLDTGSEANLTKVLDCSSPESIMEPTKVTPASDRYSLGCVLYYLLTSRYPFQDCGTSEKILAHQTRQPTPLQEVNARVPPALAAIVVQLMQKAPIDRYRSTAEVVDALRPLAKGPPKPARTPTTKASQSAAKGSSRTASASASASSTSATPSQVIGRSPRRRTSAGMLLIVILIVAIVALGAVIAVERFFPDLLK
jgi:serine/threonine-protein kinase